MSNLESKTLKEILFENGITPTIKGWGGSMNLILSQKYIAEIFAQKEIADLEIINRNLEADKVVMQKGINEYRGRSEVLGSRVLELSAKIAEANKILDEFLDLYSAHYEINTKIMERLREVLK